MRVVDDQAEARRSEEEGKGFQVFGPDRAAGVVVAIAGLGRGDLRYGTDQVWGLLAGRFELHVPQGGGAPGADAAVAPGLIGDPFDGVVAVFSPVRIEGAGRQGAVETAPIDDHEGVIAAGNVMADAQGQSAEVKKLLIVGRLDQNDREGVALVREIEVGGQGLSVAHGDLDRFGIELGRGGKRPEEQKAESVDRVLHRKEFFSCIDAQNTIGFTDGQGIRPFDPLFTPSRKKC